jgi:hypothetical protein
VEDWAEIRRLHGAEGMAIVRRTGVSRNAVRRALAADRPPRYDRPARGSLVDAVEPQIRELLGSWPTTPTMVIAERIGRTHSLTILKDRVLLDSACTGRCRCRGDGVVDEDGCDGGGDAESESESE